MSASPFACSRWAEPLARVHVWAHLRSSLCRGEAIMSAQSQLSHPEAPVVPVPPLADAARPGASPIPQPEFGSARFKADPFAYYARLRAEAPVFQMTVFGRQRGWLVTRYDDVVAV